MQYQQLDSIQIHQMLAETMYMREVEYRGYEQNLAAFTTMIADPTIDPGYKAQVNQWITETKSAMAQVELWFNGLQSQITDPSLFSAAVGNSVALRQGDSANKLVVASTALAALPAAQTALSAISATSALASTLTALSGVATSESAAVTAEVTATGTMTSTAGAAPPASP